MYNKTVPKSFRVTPDTARRLADLANLWEISQTAVVEQLIKKAAIEEGLEQRASKRLAQMLKMLKS